MSSKLFAAEITFVTYCSVGAVVVAVVVVVVVKIEGEEDQRRLL